MDSTVAASRTPRSELECAYLAVSMLVLLEGTRTARGTGRGGGHSSPAVRTELPGMSVAAIDRYPGADPGQRPISAGSPRYRVLVT